MAQILKLQSGGKLNFGNDSIDVTEDIINQYRNWGQNLPEDVRQAYDKIINGIRSGEYTIDLENHTISGDNIEFGLSERENRALHRDQTKTGQIITDLIRPELSAVQAAIQHFTSYRPSKPDAPRNHYDISSPLTINYEYDGNGGFTTVNGNRTYLGNQNDDPVLKRLDLLSGLTNTEEWSDTHDSITGYNDQDVAAYRELLHNVNIDDLKTRITDGSITDEDKTLLESLGIFADGTDNDRRHELLTQYEANAPYRTAGIASTNIPTGFAYDTTNGWSITDPNLLSLIGGRDVWLNASFANENEEYNDLIANSPEGLGYFWINGQLYAANNLRDLQQLDAFQRMVEARMADLNEDNQYIKWNWSGKKTFYDTLAENEWSPLKFIRDSPVVQYLNRTYSNLNNPTFVLSHGFNEYGDPITQEFEYVKGNFRRLENFDRSSLTLREEDDLFDETTNPFILDLETNGNKFRTYISGNMIYVVDSNDPNKYFFFDGQKWRDQDNTTITDPKILQRLNNPMRFTRYHQTGGVLQYGPIRQRYEAPKSNQSNSSSSQSTISEEPSEREITEDLSNVLGGEDFWTNADKLEVAALVADIGSLGISFVPGANLAAAGIGAAGSITNFASDVSRDGLDWGDVGELGLNLLFDIGTIVPGLGGVSKSAKAAKAIKSSSAIRKFMDVLGKATGVTGAANAILTSWENIQDGEWTVSDIRNIVNGIHGAMSITRAPSTGRRRDGIELASREHPDNPVVITGDQLRTLRGRNIEEQQNILLDIAQNNGIKYNSPTEMMSDLNLSGRKRFIFGGEERIPLGTWWGRGNRTPHFEIRPKGNNWYNFWRNPAINRLNRMNSGKPVTPFNYANYEWAPLFNAFSVGNQPTQEEYYGVIVPTYQEGGIMYGNTPRRVKPPIGQYLDASRLDAAIKATNKIAEETKEGIINGMIGSQQDPIRLQRKLGIDNGLYRKTVLTNQQLKSAPLISSDVNQNYANQLMRDVAVNQNLNAANAQLSAMVDQNEAANLEISQKEALANQQIATANRQAWSKGLAALNEAEKARITANATSVNQMLYQIRKEYDDEQKRRSALEERSIMSNAEIEYKNSLRQLFESKGSWNNLTNEQREEYGNDWQRYVEETYPTEATNLLLQARTKAYNQIWQNSSTFDRRPFTSPTLMPTTTPSEVPTTILKKGGTLSLNDKIILQQRKDVSKSIEKINDKIFKLFIEMYK